MQDFIRFMQTVDIAVSALMALLGLVLLSLFFRAYLRSRRRLFLILGIGALALALANILTAAIYIYAATNLKIIPLPAIETVYVVQILCGISGGILSFIGTVLLLRFALPSGVAKTQPSEWS